MQFKKSNQKYSEKVKILPWIGENYFNEEERLLILGVSTYFKDSQSKKDCVKDFIKSICNGDKRRGSIYLIKTENLLKNKKETSKNFWNRISFYNYVQEITDMPKQKSPEEYLEFANKALIEILKKLMPDKVIVIGHKLFQNLPDKFEKEKSIVKNGKELKIAYYFMIKKDHQKNIVFLGIWHPLRNGFKNEDWRNLLKEYYKKEKRDWADAIKLLKELGKFVVDA